MTEEQLQPILNERFRHWLIYRCMQMGDCQFADAEEIVQHVYLILWETSSYQPDKGSVSNYAIWRLRGVLHNHLVTRMRRQRRIRIVGEFTLGNVPAQPAERNGSHAELQIETAKRYADQDLTALQTIAVFETLLEGRSLSELARESGVSRQSVHLNRVTGLKKLKRQFEEDAA